MPSTICSANSPAPCATAPHPPPLVPRIASINAIPTGSLAPDSPSSSVPVRPATSRRPSTEKTTAGSVGARAVPTSSAARQSKSNRVWARTASTPAVTKVPATPSHTTPPATGRKRDTPMCMPPSKRIRTSAIVTIRWSARIDSEPRSGKSSAHSEAATRKIAGVGHAHPLADPARADSRQQREGGDDDHQCERGDVVHEGSWGR